MKLDNLYSLRKEFTLIGITGRTGSGCTMISEFLSKDFQSLKGLRKESEFDDVIFRRKYEITKSFLSHKGNWQPFEVIKYKSVLLFYILHRYGGDYSKMKSLFRKFFRESKTDNNGKAVSEILKEIQKLDKEYKDTIKKIRELKKFESINSVPDLKKLNDLYFEGNFKNLSKKIFELLENHGYYRRTRLLHSVSCNIRSNGDPLDDEHVNIDSIFSIALLINKLVKARKDFNGNKPTKIVIDSLRNSLEIMFFKERYSAFYMLATKDVLNNAKGRIEFRLKNKIKDDIERDKVVKKLLELDETEYKTNDFASGKFSSPDVENCIQKSDYHIFNLKKNQIKKFTDNTNVNKNGFLVREEQLMKFIALIQQPGLITPSSLERSMQIANTAKLNSGCISRKVGAVITDVNYYLMSCGWNDVAKGHTPCNLRSVEDYFGDEKELNKSVHYSDFEKGIVSNLSNFKYKNEKLGNFKAVLIDYFNDSLKQNKEDLNGKNCSFCFKTIHNHYEGEANQVHTRSLHAEENAMLQITKLGGQGVVNGSLFTTASPCELCSKKAYQLGIRKIYFIDPYPGISNDQILKGGDMDKRPKMIPFSGAIGTVYHKLYEPFLAYKDEISMTLNINPKNGIGIQFKNVLKKIDSQFVKDYLKEKTEGITNEDIIDLIERGLKSKA
ncbi:cytidine/deoxycytidylate deaminase-like protein [Flavobacterium endophyticum]|uniref:Cytidine/deoxycytidylate deaminase-like protein n=1 Tax=Flavobacterium endophyticum TaxID=1540163 RepID=A0A495MLJ0_9FLAO|nr:hypothetical protein [Flavobacterium endophyticum]RKS25199.1 cytidine/deoxycytidylate deaminase-like protein [Flavobacterium endophyticum]